jgi:predicted CXXCH cytochrome family protein
MSSGPDKRHELERKLAVAHHLPSLGFISLLAAAASAAVFFVWPASSGTRRGALAAAPVSNHHRQIDSACERCHGAPFAGAPDDRCLKCHTVGGHAAAFTDNKIAGVGRCASCHKEHHGERSLIPADSPLCTGCHAQITKVFPKSAYPSVSDFAHHPDFRRTAAGDDSALKFSHAEHLGVVQKRGGEPETLSCGNCHVRAPEGPLFQPIAFVKHCERCHQLDFDKRIKGTPVPHGDVDRAVAVVRAALAEFSLNADEGNNLPTAKLRAHVEDETRDTIDALFTEQDGCKRCHEVGASGPPDQRRYVVAHPGLRPRWLVAARFDHAVHRQTACEQCHAGARTSTSSSEVLIPGIKVCRECHADPGTPNKVESPCVECHVYHSKS